jgi:ABC-type transporter Mla MlaB component
MSSTSRNKAKAGQLALTGELTIYEAAGLKTLLLDRLNANKSLEIDLSGVTELDTTGVQLMLLLQREAAAASKPLQWVKHSQAVSQVLALLNLGSALGDPVSLVWS